MKHHRRGFGLVLVTLLCAFAFLRTDVALGQEKPLPAVVVAPAEMSDLRPRFVFSGRLVASQRVDIRARVTGFLEEVLFEEGATVEEGTVLYRVEDDAYAATVDEISGSINAAEAEVRLAEIERDRKATLVERDTVAQSELDIAVANLGKAEGELKRLRASLDRAKLDLSYTEIKAPLSGQIGLTSVDPGAFISPESGVLTTLTLLDPMTVEFPIVAADLLRLRMEAGEKQTSSADTIIEIALPTGQTYPERGEINFIDARASRSTDTVIARAVFPNPKGLLLDGALVGVEVQRAEERLILNIPQRSVQRDQTGPFAMVVDEAGKVELRRLTVGETIKGRTEVAEGLSEGELVITEGINKVRPGIVVDAAVANGG